MPDLSQLAQRYKEALLLAEVGALLHDMGKCTSEFAYVADARSTNSFDPYKAIFTTTELQQFQFSAQRLQERLNEANQQYALHKLLNTQTCQSLDASFTIAGDSYTFREVIYFCRPRFAGNIGRPLGHAGEPLDLLAFCHGKGHVEKEEPQPVVTPQPVARYSAFGCSLADLPKPDDVENLTQRLNDLDWDALLQRHEMEELRRLFGEALGDTRFPINEVTLWDWSYTVASLYKVELARYFLTGEWRARDALRWRLLRVNFDVLGLYGKALKIADLLGYQNKVKAACRAVKRLVEEDYPLGNEVYHDTTGIYFTFPDLPLAAELKRLIRQRVTEIEPELAPRVAVGCGDGETATKQLKTILAKQRAKALRELTRPVTPENHDPCWQALWDNLPSGRGEVCSVCRLRPKLEDTEACEQCLDRRQSRIQTWLGNPSQTIWMDEISGAHGRVALLVGHFGLDDWLSGDLVQTLLVKAIENDPDACQSKNPSPARLRRVWETTQRFWEQIETTTLLKQSERQPRLTFSANYVPVQGHFLEDRQAYDLVVDGYKLPVFCQERNALRFLTIDRLDYVLQQLGRESVEDLKEFLKRGEHALETPGEYGARSVRIGSLRNIEVTGQLPYTPAIPLLAEPRTFMALVPADKAIDIARAIKTKYDIEMGKVRNRLPLHLGLVFFPRKQPLRAVLEAGRRMLSMAQPDEMQVWQLTEDAQVQNGNCTLHFDNDVEWDIPVLMGDKKTKDNWYPYFFIKEPGENALKPKERRLAFEGVRPYGNGKTESCWLVHAKELAKGDQVYVTPSRFDFEFLDITARRFEVSYENGKRRTPAKRNRPYLLDDLERFAELWKMLCELSTSQIKALDGLIEAKRAAWEQGTGQKEYCAVFKRFVRDALNNAGWPKDQRPTGENMEQLHHAALTGKLHDLLELYMEILKQRPKRDQERGETDGSSQVG